MKKFVTIGLACALALLGGCTPKRGEELVLYAPDGAPALALAGMMAQDTKEDGVEYRVVAPAKIATTVTNKEEDKNADLCVLPVTAASKLLGTGERYTMLGTLTHGNLYIVAKADAQIDGLDDLVGKTVGTLQMAEVPGLTLKATLNKAGLPWQEYKNGDTRVENKVNLLAITGADAVGTVEADCFLLAEPAVTAQSKKGYSIALDLQRLYGGEAGYPQAVLVAKNSLVKEKNEWLTDFVSKLESSLSWVGGATGAALAETVTAHLEDADYTSALKAPMLSSEVVSRCGLRFSYASADKQEVIDFLTATKGVNDKATELPADGFFWSYTK